MSPKYDLLLKGGNVIDPAQCLNGRMDIAFIDGKVASISEQIPSSTANSVVAVNDKLIMPGLIACPPVKEDRSAPVRIVPDKSLSDRSTLVRFAPVRSLPDRSTLVRIAPVRSAPVRIVPVRSLFDKSVYDKLALVKFTDKILLLNFTF